VPATLVSVGLYSRLWLVNPRMDSVEMASGLDLLTYQLQPLAKGGPDGTYGNWTSDWRKSKILFVVSRS
jgi:hypothetical protein